MENLSEQDNKSHKDIDNQLAGKSGEFNLMARRDIDFYSLELVISVGFRVNSFKAMRF